jgi:hypothetical protein
VLPAWRAAAGLLATGVAAGTDFHTASAAEQANAVDPAAVDTASAPALTFLKKGVYNMVSQLEATAACLARSALL